MMHVGSGDQAPSREGQTSVRYPVALSRNRLQRHPDTDVVTLFLSFPSSLEMPPGFPVGLLDPKVDPTSDRVVDGHVSARETSSTPQ